MSKKGKREKEPEITEKEKTQEMLINLMWALSLGGKK